MKTGFEQTGNIQQLSNGYIQIATGNTTQRPSTANVAMLRYNTSINNAELYSNTATWNGLTQVYTSNVAPSVFNDQANGFAVGMTWIANNNVVYNCTNNSVGAAKWTTMYQDVWSMPGFSNGTNAQYYGSVLDNGQTQLGTASYATGTIYYIPILIGAGMSFDRIGFYVSTATTGNVRMALYSNNYPLGQPLNLILDCGNIAVSSTGAKEYSITPSISPSVATMYWLAVQTSVTETLLSMSFFGGCATSVLGRATLSSGGTGNLGFTSTATFGAFPSTVGTLSTNTTNAPFLWLRNI